jgi:hypothetical protein
MNIEAMANGAGMAQEWQCRWLDMAERYQNQAQSLHTVYKLCNYELVLVNFYIVKCPNQVLHIQNVRRCPLNSNPWPTPTSCRCW